MKYVGSLFSKMAAYGVALLVAHSAATAQAQQQQGKAVVRAVRGSAQYSQGGDWMPLAVDKVLLSGAVVKTAPGAQVDLFMDKNGPVVRITGDTVLALNSLKFEETGTGETVIETLLNLTNGRILGSVKPLAAASKYEVKIPTGTVGIRGTEYDISANGVVHIKTGAVDVNWVGQPAPFRVMAGQTFTPPAAPGGAPNVGSTSPAILQELITQFTEIGGITIPEKPPITPIKPLVVPPTEPPVSPTTGETPGSSSPSHPEGT